MESTTPTMTLGDAYAIIINDMGDDLDRATAHVKSQSELIAKLIDALEAADLYLNNYDTSKPSRIKAETRAIVAEALAL